MTIAAKPLASIVVPVYNGERYLREALDSACAQDYEPCEIVVVDDGSEDGTPRIIRSYDRVRRVRQDNAGLARAKNVGVEAARGEYITFLDADDVLAPDRVSTQLGYLLEHPSVGCVLGRQEIMFDGIERPEWMRRDTIYGDLDGIPFVSAMFRRSVLESVGGFDESYAHREDRDLFVRLREHDVEIAVLPQIVLFRRFHGSNMTGSHPGKHPLLRSLKAKVDRSRAASVASEERA
jgi:glycosyltransferase involved in cell wall biosynthesis